MCLIRLVIELHICILLAALKQWFYRGGGKLGKKSLFRRLQVNVGIDDIGQVDAVEEIGGLIAHLKH
jgi:hypothetical protein